MPPPTTILPTLTLSLPIPASEPTDAPLNLPVLLDKRQTYVTVSVMKNTTSDDSTSSKDKSSGFPVAIAIPALVGGMALALAGFGIWYWWTRKVKREKREAWEARERRKRKRAEQSARPSVSSSTRTPSSGQKSPLNEKGFIPPVPALPKHAATQDPYKERGYGYSGLPQQNAPAPAPGAGAGAFGYATQPGFEQDLGYNHTYDQYGQPIVEQQHQQQYYNNQDENPQQQNYGHSRGKSTDSSDPSNPFSNQNSESPLPSTTKEEEIPVLAPPVKSEKSSKRALARMNLADSKAANQSVDPAYRHQPKKPSPLALAAAERKAAEAHAERERMEMLAPPQNESSLPPYDQNGNRAVSGEWGVALGSPNNDGQFDFNRQDYQDQEQEDPYLQQQRGKSGMYTQDPYASYHGNRDSTGDDQDGDVYHKAAEGMGLGGGKSTPTKSRWV